uniref:Uncharacterized protein n=1 Tax=Pipistrellus kuhlii TaxID=59472 RepID=A0A7J7VBY2_PIPKU|nr:hypothetical protein mPipKuh1_008529 [Pipistrellus kuhlii]
MNVSKKHSRHQSTFASLPSSESTHNVRFSPSTALLSVLCQRRPLSSHYKSQRFRTGLCAHGKIRAFATDSCWPSKHLENSSTLKKVHFLNPRVYLLLKTSELFQRGSLCGNASLPSGPSGGP